MKQFSFLLLAVAVFGVSTPWGSVSAAVQRPSKVADRSTFNEADWRRIAEEELRKTEEAGMVARDTITGKAAAPTQSTSREEGEPTEEERKAISGIVSMDFLPLSSADPRARSEFEIGAQLFRPVGLGNLAARESYRYDQLSQRPMGVAAVRHWFWAPLNGRYRLGGQGQVGMVSHSFDLRSERGTPFNDLRVNSFLGVLGPEAEYFLLPSLALGARAGVGQIFLSQSGPSSVLQESKDATFWEIGPSIRWQPGWGFFAKISWLRRSMIGSDRALGIQESNLSANIGIGM
jgi:hypothetical protein